MAPSTTDHWGRSLSTSLSPSPSVKVDRAILRNWCPRHDFGAPQSTDTRTVMRGTVLCAGVLGTKPWPVPC